MGTAAVETKGERTRRRILDAAVAHFAAVGLDQGSVPEIARQVGVSHSALYQHFGRKEELFRAAVDADLTALLDEVAPHLDATAPTARSLTALAVDLVGATTTHPLARRVLANLDGEQAEVLRDLPALRRLQRRLEQAVRTGQAAGAVRRDLRPGVTAEGLMTVSLALLAMAIRLEGHEFPRADAAVRFLTEVLRPVT
ncbi:MAG: TetR/AcrR family transcriptional regulator [Acidimicrobiales bacterium]